MILLIQTCCANAGSNSHKCTTYSKVWIFLKIINLTITTGIFYDHTCV